MKKTVTDEQIFFWQTICVIISADLQTNKIDPKSILTSELKLEDKFIKMNTNITTRAQLSMSNLAKNLRK